ncbi:MAG: PBSX family phage terminase large subunit, partial [Rhodospirillales bacterium]|nr:PBSX family phage terminase large subunit [Rhodospirillales bacterium]
RQYRKAWDDKRKVFHDRPLHDWASHPADAFRYLALGLPEVNSNLNSGFNRKIAYSSGGIA